jgi:hypothetical protein
MALTLLVTAIHNITGLPNVLICFHSIQLQSGFLAENLSLNFHSHIRIYFDFFHNYLMGNLLRQSETDRPT